MSGVALPRSFSLVHWPCSYCSYWVDRAPPRQTGAFVFSEARRFTVRGAHRFETCVQPLVALGGCAFRFAMFRARFDVPAGSRENSTQSVRLTSGGRVVVFFERVDYLHQDREMHPWWWHRRDGAHDRPCRTRARASRRAIASSARRMRRAPRFALRAFDAPSDGPVDAANRQRGHVHLP